jgi:hypothetical protein
MNNHVRALTLAKEALKTKRVNYICHALEVVSLDHSELRVACDELQKTVMERLNGPVSLETWIMSRKLHGRWSVFGKQFQNKIRITRLAWIDSLIEEFSKSQTVPRRTSQKFSELL